MLIKKCALISYDEVVMRYCELLSQHSCYESSLCQGGSYLDVAPRARYSITIAKNRNNNIRL